jgi:hypothetical protein
MLNLNLIARLVVTDVLVKQKPGVVVKLPLLNVRAPLFLNGCVMLLQHLRHPQLLKTLPQALHRLLHVALPPAVLQ